jgi:hypothetical protein
MQQLCSSFKISNIILTLLEKHPFGHGWPNMNELLLKKAHVLKDFAKLLVAITNYASRSLFMTQIPHL